MPTENRPAESGVVQKIGFEGLELAKLPPGTIVEAQTRNSTYEIRMTGGGRMELRRQSEQFQEFVGIDYLGSVLVTGESCNGWVVPGMPLEVWSGNKRVYTSRVAELRVRRD